MCVRRWKGYEAVLFAIGSVAEGLLQYNQQEEKQGKTQPFDLSRLFHSAVLPFLHAHGQSKSNVNLHFKADRADAQMFPFYKGGHLFLHPNLFHLCQTTRAPTSFINHYLLCNKITPQLPSNCPLSLLYLSISFKISFRRRH